MVNNAAKAYLKSHASRNQETVDEGYKLLEIWGYSRICELNSQNNGNNDITAGLEKLNFKNIDKT